MNLPDPRKLSLRARFALGLGAVLVPLLLAAAVGRFYLLPALVEPTEDVVREFTEKMMPTVRLQLALHEAAMPVNDYLIHADPSERANFARLAHQANLAVAVAWGAPFGRGEERELIETVRREWEQARELGKSLLEMRRPVGDPQAARAIERFDAHIDRAVALLDRIHNMVHGEIHVALDMAHAARTRSIWVTVGAFTLALAVSFFAAAALARSVLAPMRALDAGARRFGAGEFSHRVELNGPDELGQLAETFNAMAGALENSRAALVELSVRDGLTGLYNHREFRRRLGEEIKRSRRYTRPLALLMFDIDHFKRVNDTHGHLAGIVRQTLRPADSPARYGGEEFAVILPETPVAGAVTLAERLRAAVAAASATVAPGQAVSVTVSIGVAALPEDAATDETLVAAADRALYAAKQSGRNRVCRPA